MHGDKETKSQRERERESNARTKGACPNAHFRNSDSISAVTESRPGKLVRGHASGQSKAYRPLAQSETSSPGEQPHRQVPLGLLGGCGGRGGRGSGCFPVGGAGKKGIISLFKSQPSSGERSFMSENFVPLVVPASGNEYEYSS